MSLGLSGVLRQKISYGGTRDRERRHRIRSAPSRACVTRDSQGAYRVPSQRLRKDYSFSNVNSSVKRLRFFTKSRESTRMCDFAQTADRLRSRYRAPESAGKCELSCETTDLQLCLLFARSLRPNRQGVQSCLQFLVQGLVHKAMSLQAALLSKQFGNDFDTIMGLAAGCGSGMSRVQVALVDNRQPVRPKLGRECLFDAFCSVHRRDHFVRIPS